MDTKPNAKVGSFGSFTALFVLLCFGTQACHHRSALPGELLRQDDLAAQAAPAPAPLQSLEPEARLRAQLLSPAQLQVEEGAVQAGPVQPLAGLQPLQLALDAPLARASIGDTPLQHRHGGDSWSTGRTVAVATLITLGAVLLLGYAYLNALGERCAPATGHGWC